MTTEQLLEIAKRKPYSIDDTLVIDAKNKKIINTSSKELILGVETDKETKRIHFLCPRIVGNGKDVSEFQIRVNFLNANKKTDFDVCTDTVFYKDYVEFSWEVSPKATKYKGMTNFIICMIKTQSDGFIKNEWNTTLAEGIVLEGLEVDIPEEEFEEPKDIVLQLLGMLDEKEAELIEEVENLRTDVKTDIESTKQKAMEDVEAKGAETLAKIPEDYTYIANLAEENKQLKANAIKRTYSGETIVARDSSGVHLEGLRTIGRSEQVSTTGKNLLKNKATTETIGGVTFTVNDDKSVTVKGTATFNVSFYLIGEGNAVREPISAGTYLLSGSNGEPSKYSLIIGVTGIDEYEQNNGIDKEIVIESDNTFYARIRVLSGVTVDTIIYPMIRLASIEDGTYEPYTGGYVSPSPDWQQPIVSVGDDGSIDVGVYGKNLINLAIDASAQITKKIPFIAHEGDWVFTLYNENGSADGIKNGSTYSVAFIDASNNIIASITFRGVTITKEQAKKIAFIVFSYDADYYEGSSTYVYGQLERSLTATEYEPYKESRSLTIQTPNGLPGIPLGTTIPDAIASSEKLMSGVYWDDKTQQYYIGDEKDYGRGKYVRRIMKQVITDNDFASVNNDYVLNGGAFCVLYLSSFIKYDENSKSVISNVAKGISINNRGSESEIYRCYPNSKNSITMRYPISYGELTLEKAKEDLTGATLYYILDEPIEEPLSTSEIEAYKALTSNYPTTTILNDENAHMEVTLVADTKNHIEQNYVSKESYDSMNERLLAVEQALLSEV